MKSQKARGRDARESERMRRRLKGEIASEATLRQVVRGILNEATEYDDDTTSMEANLAMLVFRDEVDQALMMFEMLAPMNELDLDLLATELDNRLLAEWDKMPEEPQVPPTPAEWKAYGEYRKLYWDPWSLKIKSAVRFISGDHINRSFRPPDRVYRSGSIQDTIARALKQTTTAWRKREGLRESVEDEPEQDDSAKILMLFWTQGAAHGIPLAEMTPGLEDLAKKMEDLRSKVSQWIDYSVETIDNQLYDRQVAERKMVREINHLAIDIAGLRISSDVFRGETPTPDTPRGPHFAKWYDRFIEARRHALLASPGPPHTWSAPHMRPFEAFKDWVKV
jgi:hypothetical protein